MFEKYKRRILLLFLFLFVFVGLYYLYSFLSVEDVILYDTDVNITLPQLSGFNLDSDKLHFGDVPLNSPKAFRKMDFTSPYNETVKIEISGSGNIMPWIDYMDPHGNILDEGLVFYLEPQEKVTIEYVFVPNAGEMSIGDYYTGTFRIVVKKKTFLNSFSLWFVDQKNYYF